MLILFICVFVRFPQLQFEYKDPDKGFDRKSVHGLVVRLITVKDPSTATALEVSAGGKVILSSSQAPVGLSVNNIDLCHLASC